MYVMLELMRRMKSAFVPFSTQKKEKEKSCIMHNLTIYLELRITPWLMNVQKLGQNMPNTSPLNDERILNIITDVFSGHSLM